ncbi:MAG TPA: SDR family NAD(P)-dependent oxidoreductase [Gammaproteobacteria bacterium]|nr:SDR family NAD(P)-dependent oxidoreductase [Gammaproteobacteria bacterium]
MTKLKDKIVFITGASSGIGKACAEQFAAAGAKLILTARRIERLNDLSTSLKTKYNTETLCINLDVQDQKNVESTLHALPKAWQKIDVLINNAGKALSTAKIQEGNLDDWENMIDTNIKGLLYVSRAILPGMVERNAGHIINISSTAGHHNYPNGNVYCATKHAVRSLSESMRLDLCGTAIRVTDIAPGMVHTEFSEVRWKGDKAKSDAFYTGFTPLQAVDVADTIVFCATRPPHVDIAEIVIYPTDQASPTLVNKRT